MSEHLPECYYSTAAKFPLCICDRLRLARDRGYGEAMDDGWGEPEHIRQAVAEALDRALDAASSAVNVWIASDEWSPEPLLAAIDALRGES